MDALFSRRDMFAMAGAAAMFPGSAFALTEGRGTVALKTADGRTSQVTLWRAKKRRGTILFSHGALSAPAKYVDLIEPWVSAGFDVWAPLHVDSTDHPETKRYTGLMSWPARIEDMRALSRHIGTRPYVAAGHSYGALVALTLGGAAAIPPQGVAGPLADRRVEAVVAFSPPGPMKGLIDAAGYAGLSVPAFVETGTIDVPPGAPAGPDGWRTHLTAYDAAMAGGNRYALVLDGVDHYFGGIICRPELPGPKQRPQFDQAIERSTLFLRAFALKDRGARAALDALVGPEGPAQLSRK